MRVKINTRKHGIENLEFGKRYYMAYAGMTYGEEFVFTRKNRVELCEYQKDGEMFIKNSSRRISKRKLKQILNSDFVHWIDEFH